MTARQFTQVLLQSCRVQLKLLGRHWPARLSDLLMPAAVAFVPVLLAGAVAGGEAGSYFARRASTADFAGFLLIGGGGFVLVTRALWGYGAWIRQEMRSGTLESLYLSPAAMPPILAGTALAFMLYSALIFCGAMIVGAALFQTTFQTQQLPLALVFLGLGLPAVYSLALLYGALVLQLKETEALLQIAQWLITLLMGVYFPISLFPPALKIASLLFPPTWLTQGLRASLLGIPYLSASWAGDLAVLALFGLVGPVVAYFVYSRVERRLRQQSGLGSF
jgi:ABC-type polysaccharide/polyol phosphate export permease